MTTTPWTADRPSRSPFAHPSGALGWLAGRVMLRANRQDDLIDLLDVREGDIVLEVGYGPGGLLRRLAATPAGRIDGVDPSEQMRRAAGRANRAAVADGRIRLRVGAADDTGFAGGAFDRVVSVNTLAIWPDLDAGLAELHRVTRPGGRVVLAWHGGRHPSAIGRRLRLPGRHLDRVHDALRDLFSEVVRHELATLTAFTTTR